MTKEQEQDIRRVVGKLDAYAGELLDLINDASMEDIELPDGLEELKDTADTIQSQVTDYQQEMGYI